MSEEITQYFLYDTKGVKVARFGQKSLGEPFCLNLLSVLKEVAGEDEAFRTIIEEVSTWWKRAKHFRLHEAAQRRGDPSPYDVSKYKPIPAWETETVTFRDLSRKSQYTETVEVITIPEKLITVDQFFGLIEGMVIRPNNAIGGVKGDNPNQDISVKEFRHRLELPGWYGNWSKSWESKDIADLVCMESMGGLLFGMKGLPVAIAHYNYFVYSK